MGRGGYGRGGPGMMRGGKHYNVAHDKHCMRPFQLDFFLFPVLQVTENLPSLQEKNEPLKN